ncbi:DUF6676 family protein [Corynebacterium mayonis]|uniref:Rv1476 family membrane protein n=1 Tax=Corynebacterium mayonis TaxID=3062461 RepID=UPI00313FFA0B
MIPGEIDLEDLAAQLREDGVALATSGQSGQDLDNDAFELHLQASKRDAELDNAGFVVVDQTPAQPADLRDVAHDLALATGLDLVIVRSPHASGAVSNSHSRFQVESGQRAMMAEPDYGDGLKAFAETADGLGGGWSFIAISVVIAVFAAIGTTVAWTVKRADLT